MTGFSESKCGHDSQPDLDSFDVGLFDTTHEGQTEQMIVFKPLLLYVVFRLL
jgi:hypothetical protein